MWPDEPRVGVGVVVFRGRGNDGPPGAREVLLVRRAKPPAMGLWCVPGGSLELGETLAECAAREVAEETGVVLEFDRGTAAAAGDRRLRAPTPFAAVDSIEYESGGSGGGSSGGGNPSSSSQQQQQGEGGRRVRFHYVVVEVAAVAAAGDGGATPLRAGDDVSEAKWARLDELEGLGETLVPNCARLAWEAAERFDLSPL
jgi:ADP-ribose pyrophosphatase YjhB (NUDIX family)